MLDTVERPDDDGEMHPCSIPPQSRAECHSCRELFFRSERREHLAGFCSDTCYIEAVNPERFYEDLNDATYEADATHTQR